MLTGTAILEPLKTNQVRKLNRKKRHLQHYEIKYSTIKTLLLRHMTYFSFIIAKENRSYNIKSLKRVIGRPLEQCVVIKSHVLDHNFICVKAVHHIFVTMRVVLPHST